MQHLQTPQTTPVAFSATNPFLPSSATKISTTPTPIRKVFASAEPSPPPSPPPSLFVPMQTSTPTLPSPPQLSARLRNLLEQRAPTLRVHLVPTQEQLRRKYEQQQQARKQQLQQEMMLTEKSHMEVDIEALEIRSAAWPDSPPHTGFDAWISQWDPRIVLALSLIAAMLLITGGAWMLGSAWGL